MSKKYQAPRGTNDILPIARPSEPAYESHRWQHVERVFARHAELFGYQEVRTPMFEDVELFLRTSGETSDVASKEMYEFTDKGGRQLALKPEGTAPVMRAYLEHGIGGQGGTSRFWYFTHSFRYGRPGKGRVRQLHQFGLECVGDPSPETDAEIIEASYTFYRKLGLMDLTVMVNSIGQPAHRAAFGEKILEHLKAWLADQDTESCAKAAKNPMRLLDTKDPVLRQALTGLPDVLSFLDSDSLSRFEKVQALLTEADVPYRVATDIVRGLDYYTDTVFEIVADALGEGLSLCGGGRYDGLMEQLGGPATPSVGVGMGIERLLLTMIDQGVTFPNTRLTAFFVAATDDAWEQVRSTVRACREADVSSLSSSHGRKMNQQMKAADRAKARFAVIAGEEETRKGVWTVKTMETGQQDEVPCDQIVAWLAARQKQA